MNLREAQIAASEAARENEVSRGERAMDERTDQRIKSWEEMGFGEKVDTVLNRRIQAIHDFGGTFLAKGSFEMADVATRAEQAIIAEFPEYHVYHDLELERQAFGISWFQPELRYVAADPQQSVVEWSEEAGKYVPVAAMDLDLRPSHWSQAG